jgi:signal transduction histidine kinase
MRDAKLLTAALSVAEQAARDLAGKGLTPAQLEMLDRARSRSAGSDSQPAMSGLLLADREESMADWLDAHDIQGVPVDELARTSMTLDRLDLLAQSFDGESLEAALRWITGGSNARTLAREIERAVTRIHALVSSVKGFTHMDRAPVLEPVELSRGLEDTVAILDGKASEKSVGLSLTIAPDLPPIRGIGVEINQIWMNLIDNAIDAAPTGGHVNVTAEQHGTTVVVSVTDDGTGIPSDIQENIFDPFFTTKPVGEGTGLGLDIVRRVVQWHNGDIKVESRPGRTEFRITMPIGGPR